MGVGSGGVPPPRTFIHDTNIVDRGLKVLFFGIFLLFFRSFFSLALPLWKRLNSAIFRYFFRYPPLSPGKFSADALDYEGYIAKIVWFEVG